METILPIRVLLLFVALAIAAPLVAAQKGFIGMALDGKADPGSGLNFLNPTLMSSWVKSIVPKSPADGHHITVGDIVLEIDGMPVPGCKLSALKTKLAVEAGQTIHLKLKRSNGEIYTADLTAIPKPGD
jgi:C-terminal processing protease CtpA/Prc